MIDVINPQVEAEILRDRVLQAVEFIPVTQLGTTDDCGFSPFEDDTSTGRAWRQSGKDVDTHAHAHAAGSCLTNLKHRLAARPHNPSRPFIALNIAWLRVFPRSNPR
ncbi:MAG: hypothetical protein ACU841_02285 [Gammaproteobacteria bacterium]